jgi:hypothetical protein
MSNRNVLLGFLLILAIIFMIPILLTMTDKAQPTSLFVAKSTFVGLTMIVLMFVITEKEHSERTNHPDNPS